MIKDETGFFTVVSQPNRSVFIGFLLSNDKDIQSIYTLFSDYERLRTADFHLSNYFYFTTCLSYYAETVKKAKNMHIERKISHYFLTGTKAESVAVFYSIKTIRRDVFKRDLGTNRRILPTIGCDWF